MVIKRPSLCQLSWLLGGFLVLYALFWLWLAVQQQEATLAIRPVGQGVSMSDGFFARHHLDANDIRFKSTTPQKDGLLIKFDSTAQSAAVKEVLGRALLRGYIIVLLEDNDSATTWLSRLRDTSHRFGQTIALLRFLRSLVVFCICYYTQTCGNQHIPVHHRERIYPPGIPSDNGRYYP